MADENLGTLKYDIELDTKGLQQGAKKAETIMQRMEKSFRFLGEVNQAGELLTRTGKFVFNFGKQFVDAAANVERLKAGLTSVTGSADEAEKQLKRLREVARLPGLGFVEAVQGATNLQAAGFSAEKAEESLRAFGNALASVGKGKAELDGVILALSQMQAKGKLSAEEINQIAERVPQIRQVMVDAFGTAIPKEIEGMGISIDDFVSGVNRSLLKIPPVAETASNAFENLGDIFNQLRTTIGNQVLPQITTGTTNLSKALEDLTVQLSPTNEQVEILGSQINQLTTDYTAQNESTRALITRYGEIQEALADQNIDAREAADLNDELLELVNKLKSALPGLNLLWNESGGSIDVANQALERQIELQREVVQGKYLQVVDKTTQSLNKNREAIKRANDEIKAYSIAREVLGGQRVTAMSILGGDRSKLRDALTSAGVGPDTGATFTQAGVSDRLLDLFRDTEGGTNRDRKLGVLVNQQKQAIAGYNAEILELGQSFQAFVSSHGPEMEKQFNALIQSFSNQDSQRGMNAFNRQLAEMEEGLGGIVSGDFIRSMISQFTDLQQVVKGTGQAGGGGTSGKDAVSNLFFGMHFQDVKTAIDGLFADATQAYVDGWQDLRQSVPFQMGEGSPMLRFLGIDPMGTGATGKANRQGRERKTQRDQKQAIKNQQKIRTASDKWSADQQRLRDRENDQRRQKRQREQESERRKDDQNFSNMLNREQQIETRFLQSARQRIDGEQQWEQETRAKGLQALDDLQKDQQEREREASLARRDQVLDWVDGLGEVVHAFGRIAEMTGADSVLMEQLKGVQGVLMGIGRMASGDMIGGSIATSASFMQMIDARMQQALPRMDSQTNLLKRFDTIPEQFREFMGADWTEQFHPSPDHKEFEKYHSKLENWVRGLEMAFLSEEERVRQGSQGIGQAILEGVAEGLNQNNISQTLDLMKKSLDDLLSRMILEGVMMTEGLKGNIEKLSRTVVEALRDGVIHASEAGTIQGLQSEMERVAQNVRNKTGAAFDVLGLDRGQFSGPNAGQQNSTAKGLSVAIRNITTRQADTLTRVLRGQLSLMSQIQSNTLRSATALETYLPSLETLNLSASSTNNGSTFGAKASNILALETQRKFAAAGI
jgi:tape measure domain-containing protein